MDAAVTMSLLAFATIDYVVLAFYLLAMIGVGAYFSREQRSTGDFFLAGRSMSWFPIGLSIMATLLSALSYSGIPGEAYYVGYKFLVMPLAVWLVLPLLSSVVLPLYHRLKIFSIYEYLELRFDVSTRFVSSLLFVVWRLLWMGGVLYAPCKILMVAAGLQFDTWWLLVVLGLISTFYTFLGGMKAVIWTDVIQAVVMAAGLVLVVGGIWLQLEGGPHRVHEITSQLGRAEVIDTTLSVTEKWSVWGILPHFVLAFLSFYVADQITVQRYLTAKSLRAARRSFILNCISVSIMVPALMYAGTALLAYYHDHPQQMRPIWVANVNHRDQSTALGEDGQPLIEWRPRAITPENVEQLVDERKLLRPNSDLPFTNAEGLVIDDLSGSRINIERLAMRLPRDRSLGRGEVILNRRAKDELLPHFIATHFSFGVAGLVLAALLAASMSSMDSGLNSICTLMIVDFHRRLGVGRQWLARRVGKRVEDLSEADELKLGRPMVLVLGCLATAFSLLIAQIDDIFVIMMAVVNTFGGPLLAVFLLGIFTRRTTARGALATLGAGTLFTLWIMVSNTYDSCTWLWPWEVRINGSVWPLICGVGFSLLFGYLVSCFAGARKSVDDLRGLVVGCGPLGVREPEEASIAIPESFDD
jgi:Na+/proline symporter